MASTHLEPLKGFAATHPQARNASVEFDGDRLEPTFRLVYDRPGQSYALAIGARLGLPPALIERARAHRSTQQAALQELIARLDARDRQEAERGARPGATASAESAARVRRAEARRGGRARRRARGARARARGGRSGWSPTSGAPSTRSGIASSAASGPGRGSRRRRRRLLEAGQRAAAPGPEEAASDPGRDPLPAIGVAITHLGLKGDVLDVTNGNATVRAGAVTVKVPARALRVLAARRGRGRRRRSRRRAPPPRPSAPPLKRGVGPELHLIGRTTDEARETLEKYLDDAFLAGLDSVRIVHGKGTGDAPAHGARAARRPPAGGRAPAEARLHEGGEGATVAQLRMA